jgi:hypothetical protein
MFRNPIVLVMCELEKKKSLHTLVCTIALSKVDLFSTLSTLILVIVFSLPCLPWLVDKLFRHWYCMIYSPSKEVSYVVRWSQEPRTTKKKKPPGVTCAPYCHQLTMGCGESVAGFLGICLLLLPCWLHACGFFSPYWIKHNSTSNCYRGVIFNKGCPDNTPGNQ